MRNDPLILVAAAIVVFGFSLLAFAIHTNTKGVHEATRALCAIRMQDERNVAATRQFLIEHPKGIPTLGLTAGVLERSIRLAETQIHALGDVQCLSK